MVANRETGIQTARKDCFILRLGHEINLPIYGFVANPRLGHGRRSS